MTPPPIWHFSKNPSDLVAGPFPKGKKDTQRNNFMEV